MKDYIFKNCFKIDLSAVIKLLIKGILFTYSLKSQATYARATLVLVV